MFLLRPRTEQLAQRPQHRRDCLQGERPCPFVSCRYHLYLDVQSNGKILFPHGEVDLDQLPQTCALDVADHGEHVLSEVGEVIGLTRERIRQIEEIALRHLRQALKRAGLTDLD